MGKKKKEKRKSEPRILKLILCFQLKGEHKNSQSKRTEIAQQHIKGKIKTEHLEET